MTMTISRLVFGVVAAAGMAAAQNSAPDVITAVIDGISSTSAPCSVQAWAFGATNPTVQSSGAAVKTQISPLVLTRQLDSCSPKLFSSATVGQHIAKVVLTQYADASMRTQVMVVTLTGVLVSNYQLSGSTASPLPAESVAFSFATIEFRYYTPAGSSIDVGYDVTKNAKF
jgi:type VI secretion system Hcp family effector